MGIETPSGEYIVEKNDTLSAIAKKHGFKNWQELAKLQGENFNPHLLKPGQVIRLKAVPKVSEQNVRHIEQGYAIAHNLRLSEPLEDTSTLLDGLDVTLPPLQEYAQIAPLQKPEGMTPSENLMWESLIKIGVDPIIFSDQKIEANSNGGIRITAPGTRNDKMNAELWEAVHRFKKGVIDIPVDEKLGNALRTYYESNTKGNSLFAELSDIFLGKMKKGVESAYDDTISAFKRMNVKHGFWSYGSVDELPDNKKSEAIQLLSSYAGSSDPAEIYRVTIERAFGGGTMHSIIGYLLLSMGGDYQKYGKLLQERINNGDLRGTRSRVS